MELFKCSLNIRVCYFRIALCPSQQCICLSLFGEEENDVVENTLYIVNIMYSKIWSESRIYCLDFYARTTFLVTTIPSPYNEVIFCYGAALRITVGKWQPPRQICSVLLSEQPLRARFMGPTWGPSGTDRTQVGPMLAPWTLLSGTLSIRTMRTNVLGSGESWLRHFSDWWIEYFPLNHPHANANLRNDKSILVSVIALWCWAARHYPNSCWSWASCR